MRRRFITKQEWKGYSLVKKYLIPIIFLSGVFLHVLGNWDIVLILYHLIIGTLMVLFYTRRVKQTGVKQKRKLNIKLGRRMRVLVEVLIILILIFQLYDTFRYTVAIVQIQVNNPGYVTVVSVRSGDKENRGMYANEYRKEDGRVYQHVFKGLKYLSKVDITEEITREMQEKASRSRVGVEKDGNNN